VLFDVLLILLGLASLIFGADALVRGASSAAAAWGVSDAVIGLTIVAVGTSLPELAVCIVAAIRKQAGIVLGNILGSNIFNALLIMGACLVIEPIPFKEVGKRDLAGDFGTVFVDIPASVFFSLLLFLLLLRKPRLGRMAGWLLIVCYAAYLITLGLRSVSYF
jgi:cation:H+ antiporter